MDLHQSLSKSTHMKNYGLIAYGLNLSVTKLYFTSRKKWLFPFTCQLPFFKKKNISCLVLLWSLESVCSCITTVAKRRGIHADPWNDVFYIVSQCFNCCCWETEHTVRNCFQNQQGELVLGSMATCWIYSNHSLTVVLTFQLNIIW